jgi:arylsulfatase A-like enzyme
LPAFTRLRKESTYFRVARSPTASTMTTMASIFSGRYYSQLHWSGIKAEPLAEKTPRFPEILAANGVRTMLAAGTLGQIYGKSGVARGFAKEVKIPSKPRPATATVDAILADLEAQPEGPIFIYSHFIEPHAPYDLAGKKGSKFQRYVGEIGLVDRELARLRQALAAKGLADRTYFIISADHGEGFGEHGTFNHARTVYEELVRVPLFVYAPGLAGQDVDVPASGIDIGPTILDLFGLPTPGFWMGQSLLPVVAGKQQALERPLALDTGRRMQALCFDDGYKVIFSRLQRTTEVYDLRRDPGELNNLAESNDVRARQVIDIGEFFFANIALKEQGYEIPEHKF